VSSSQPSSLSGSFYVLSGNQNHSTLQRFTSLLERFSCAFLLHTSLSPIPLSVSLLFLLCVYSCMPFSSLGRLWTCHVPSVRRKLGSVWACRKNDTPVVLRDDNFLSLQPDPLCLHSLGYLIVQPPVPFLLTDLSLGSG
jgi:hypothetical protein